LIEQLASGIEQTDIAVTAAPTQESQTIDNYLPRLSIPGTGIWVRVYYPGSFSGTLGGRGIFTTVKSTGDQLYNIPVNAGIVEGSIEKDDASAGKLVVEVYKDGAMMSRAATTIPHGLIDIHTPV